MEFSETSPIFYFYSHAGNLPENNMVWGGIGTEKITKACAGIVLYEPHIGRLCENIQASAQQTGQIILVDNKSSNIEEVKSAIHSLGEYRIMWIFNEKNEGIAFALNQIMNEAQRLGFSWVITLDQDSVCGDGMAERLMEVAKTDSSIAMVSPYIVDINLTSLEKYKAMVLPDLENVSMCITSGCLTSVDAVRAVGGFNNSLFIDQVDHEMCIRLRLAGYRIVRTNCEYLLHAVGNSRELYLVPKLARIIGSRWLSRPKYISNHPPIRVYYQTRNLLYLLRTYPGCMGRSNLRYWAGYFRGFFLKLLIEPQKFGKLTAFIRGIRDGLRFQGSVGNMPDK